MTSPKSSRYLLWAAACTIVLDLWTKSWAVRQLKTSSVRSVLPGWLQWHLLYNAGASFGWMTGHTVLLIVIGVAACVGLLYWGLTSRDRRLSLAGGLILGGAVGNLYDRVTLGAVRDFIAVWFWPAVFNVADMAIRFGVVMALVVLFRAQPHSGTSPTRSPR